MHNGAAAPQPRHHTRGAGKTPPDTMVVSLGGEGSMLRCLVTAAAIGALTLLSMPRAGMSEARS